MPQLQFAREPANDGAMLVVRSHLRVGRLEAALGAAAAPLSSQLLLGAPKPLDDYLGGHFRQRRFQLGLAVAFASAALGLAALGVYGALAFSVVQRRRELAVRAALGAQRRQLSALVLARGARLALLGISVGIRGALALSRFLAALLYGVGERDPLTLAVATMTLGFVALVASLLPARAAAPRSDDGAPKRVIIDAELSPPHSQLNRGAPRNRLRMSEGGFMLKSMARWRAKQLGLN